MNLDLARWQFAITPIVLAYQSWTYWVFRRRIGREAIPADGGLPASPTVPAGG